jgi:hypothetical protein
MHSEIEHTLLRLEHELLQPETRKSPSRLNEMIVDSFLEIGSSGKRYSKQNVISTLQSAPETKYSLSDFAIKEISPEITLATYRVEAVELKSGNKRVSFRSSLWKKSNGKWQMLFHQGTPVIS